MSKIFISYRRDDSADIVGRIYDRLIKPLGPFDRDTVFKDVDSIPLGVNFKTHLENIVNQCAVELVVIGPQWLGITNKSGQRRLDDASDFVRIEIEAALSRDVPVIPLLVYGAVMPSIDQLPISLESLAYQNGTSIRPDPDFHRDMTRVCSAVEHWLQNAPTPQSATDITNNAKIFTVADYKRALKATVLTKNERKMIQGHYSAPNHTLSVLEIAQQAGYDHPNGFNSVYGHLAKKIAQSLSTQPFEYYVEYVCTFSKSEIGWIVTMNGEFAQALKELGYVR